MLDEADRLLEQSFETELRVIAGCLPGRRQTLLFSATLTRSLAMLQASALRDAHIFQARAEALTSEHVAALLRVPLACSLVRLQASTL